MERPSRLGSQRQGNSGGAILVSTLVPRLDHTSGSRITEPCIFPHKTRNGLTGIPAKFPAKFPTAALPEVLLGKFTLHGPPARMMISGGLNHFVFNIYQTFSHDDLHSSSRACRTKREKNRFTTDSAGDRSILLLANMFSAIALTVTLLLSGTVVASSASDLSPGFDTGVSSPSPFLHISSLSYIFHLFPIEHSERIDFRGACPNTLAHHERHLGSCDCFRPSRFSPGLDIDVSTDIPKFYLPGSC